MPSLAPELLLTAKTQRWSPEEFLRTLIEAGLSARDASNARTRLKAAAFPVAKTLDEFDVSSSSIPQATFDYLASMEWVGHGRISVLLDRRVRARATCSSPWASPRSKQSNRYFTAADLVDNSVGRVIETLLRADLVIVDELGFAPLDDTGAQLLFRLVAAAYERRALGISSHWPFGQWGRFLPEHTTARELAAPQQCGGHRGRIASDATVCSCAIDFDQH